MKEVLCFGDSNTYGLIPKENARFSREIRWTGLVEKELYDRGYRIIEEGLCGRTTIFEDELRANRKGCDMLPALLESHGLLDIVVLMLGTNDCKSYYHASAEVIGLGIEKLIEQIRHYSSSIKILLVSPILLGEQVGQAEFDPEFDSYSVTTSKQLKSVYEKVARRQNVAFMAASDYACASEKDQEHLEEEGHRNLSVAMSSKIMQLGA